MGTRRFPKGDRKALWSCPQARTTCFLAIQKRISPFAKGDQGFAVALDLRGAFKPMIQKQMLSPMGNRQAYGLFAAKVV